MWHCVFSANVTLSNASSDDASSKCCLWRKCIEKKKKTGWLLALKLSNEKGDSTVEEDSLVRKGCVDLNQGWKDTQKIGPKTHTKHSNLHTPNLTFIQTPTSPLGPFFFVFSPSLPPLPLSITYSLLVSVLFITPISHLQPHLQPPHSRATGDWLPQGKGN